MKYIIFAIAFLLFLPVAAAQFDNPRQGGGAALSKGDTVSGTLTASSGVEDFLTFDMTANQSGTAGFHGLDIQLTMTAEGSGVTYPISLQVDGAYIFALEDIGNIWLLSNGATGSALIQRNIGLVDNPTFSIGSIETTAVGDGYFIRFSDDVLTAGRKVWGVEETGTVASLMASGSSGVSHFEAFHNGGVNPLFRLSSANLAMTFEFRSRNTDQNDYLYFRRLGDENALRICGASGSDACKTSPIPLSIEAISAEIQLTSIAAQNLTITGGDAFTIATAGTQREGGNLLLSGGESSNRFGIADRTKCAGDTATIVITEPDETTTQVDLVEGVDWTAETDNATTAANLCAAIDAHADLVGVCSSVWAGVHREKTKLRTDISVTDAGGGCFSNVEDEPGAVLVHDSGLRPSAITADPCANTSQYPIGSIFYNSTSNYMCFCGASNVDLKMNDNTTACF